MGGLSCENIHAKRKRLIVELVKGKEMATQLQTLLHKLCKDDGHVSFEDLALQILKSFSETLSMLSSCAASNGDDVDGGGSASSGGRSKKGRRGSYKRRRTCNSWMTTVTEEEDGYAWRKYGEKNILNSEYPRCYFRCTQKSQGCKAKKQVQRVKENPILYETTYFNHHTCPTSWRPPPPLIPDSSPLPVEPSLINFETDTQSRQNYSTNPIAIIKKEKSISEDISDAKPAIDPWWQEIIGSELSFGYGKPNWAPMMTSYEEICNFHFDDKYY